LLPKGSVVRTQTTEKKEKIKMSSRKATGVILIVAVMFLSAGIAVADELRGGLLYDKWWAINGNPEPTGEHPLYPPIGQKSGSTTFRCKECHGWDYKGADGAYGPSNSHFTGIPGVFGTTLSAGEMFDLLKNPDTITVNGHDFGNIGLADFDINDLIDFVQIELIDTDLFISPNAIFLGDEVVGEMDYNGDAACSLCHGVDGTNINFGSAESPKWVGTIASENPWEFIHKVRMGQPGSPMPGWVSRGGSDQEAANVGRHSQMNLAGGTLIFEDGFETGDTSGWDSTEG
jgi:hypothetical protein